MVLTDGTELKAGLIVCATGYGSMNGWLADLVSAEVADRVGKCWRDGSDTPKDPGPWAGELRNMWKPTSVPNPLDPRRQPAPGPALLVVRGPAAQGPDGRPGYAGLRTAGQTPHALSAVAEPAERGFDKFDHREGQLQPG